MGRFHYSIDGNLFSEYKWLMMVAAIAVVMVPRAASAHNVLNDIFKGILGASMQSAARHDWQRVDGRIRSCLARRFGINTNQLAQQAIVPTDPRLRSRMDECQREVAVIERRNQAIQAWNDEDREMKNCLVRRFGVNPQWYGQRGIGPDDNQLQSQNSQCQQIIANEKQRQREEQRLAEERREAAVKAAKERAAELAAERAAHHHKLIEKYGSAMTAAIEAHKIEIGMSQDEVLASQGTPNRRELVPPTDELLYYGSERVALSNGKVTYVGH